MPAGRPTKYDPKYCEMLIEHMKQGFSFESFGADIDVHKETLYEWANVHPEFSDAKKTGFQKNLKFWEWQGIQGMHGDKETTFNATVWIFNMKNRHRWADRKEIEAKVEDTTVREKVKALPMQELKKLVSENLKEEA